MVLSLIDPHPILYDDSSGPTAPTPPETIDLLPEDRDPLDDATTFLVPWPSSTFMIRCVSSGHVLTLLNGQIALTQPSGRGSVDWACVEAKGWLGFRNVVSGKFLGHDAKGRLCCSAERLQGWEYFCVRMRPEGGCVLLMRHYERLWHLGVKVGAGGREGGAGRGEAGEDWG